MTGIERYEFVEIASTDKPALHQAAKEGYTQYGMSKMRDVVTLKLRRVIGKGKTK